MSDNPAPKESSRIRDYSSSHLHKGEDYDGRFVSLPGRRLMWEQEQRLLTALIAGVPRKSTYLDFASGTGRILALAAPSFRQAYALDISGSMLSIAKARYPSAHFIDADFRDDPPILDDVTFDLITAFRFFPNAEAPLRHQAIHYLAEHLGPNGQLIVNNHRSHHSLSYRILRGFRHRATAQSMRHSEMLRLGQDASLRLIKTFSLGVVPQTETRAVLPWSAVSFIEHINCKTCAARHSLGYNTIYVFMKNNDCPSQG